jgi:hypothetical protein
VLRESEGEGVPGSMKPNWVIEVQKQSQSQMRLAEAGRYKFKSRFKDKFRNNFKATSKETSATPA